MVPKTPDSKIGVVGSTSNPKRERFTENLSIYDFSPAPNSPLENPSNFGATTSHWLLYIYYFSFSDFNRMDAWSLMRGDAFIHFVSGSRRVYIRLGVLWLFLNRHTTVFTKKLFRNLNCYLNLSSTPCLARLCAIINSSYSPGTDVVSLFSIHIFFLLVNNLQVCFCLSIYCLCEQWW